MSLNDKIEAIVFAHRDVEISLNGALVMQREQALAAVQEAHLAARQAELELQQETQRDHPDDRLGKTSEHPILESAVKTTQEKLDEARAAVVEIEEQMRADLTTFRVHALPKDEFEKLKLEGAGDPTRTYSLIVRASVSYVNDDGEEEQIAGQLWDQLEPRMTEGQWKPFVDAIDELNIVFGQRRHDFLGRGSATIRS